MKKTDYITGTLLVLFGVASRTIWHLGPNIEFVTAIAILSGIAFKRSTTSLLTVMSIMFISDLIIGNTNIFIFTWSGFILPVLLGKLINKFADSKTVSTDYFKLGLGAEVSAIVATIFFFLWTNFGHWVTTAMYTKDLSGLINSYVNALPFLRGQLGTNMLIVPIFVLTFVWAKNQYFHNKTISKFIS